MGNLESISVDSYPITLDGLKNVNYEENHGQETKFHSNLKMFSFENSNQQKLIILPIHFQKFIEFEPEKCYLLIHFKNNSQNQYENELEEEKLTINTILKSATKNLTPRGLEYSFSIFQTSINEFEFDLYLWNGISSSNSLQAECLSICYNLEEKLNEELNLETLFFKGKPVSIKEYFPGETMDSTSFRNYLKNILLVKNLSNPFGEIKGEEENSPLTISELLGNEKTKENQKIVYQKLRKSKSTHLTPPSSPNPFSLVKLSPIKRKSSNFTESPRKKTPRTPRKISIPKVITQSPISSSGSSNRRNIENEEFLDGFDEPLTGASVVPIYLKIISKIRENLYLGADNMARNKQQLINNGITHILNCAKITCDEYFPEDFIYKSMNLYDAGIQPVIGLFFETIQFIESAISNGGRVFVHCVQGVSRSTTFILSYLIWKERNTFRSLNEDVKLKRPVCSPNAGFIVQLMRWENLILHHHFKETLLFRISPLNDHYGKEHKQIGPLFCESDKLDSRTCFILYDSNKIFIWIGSKMKEGFEERAKQFIASFQSVNDVKIEKEIEIINEDLETEEFLHSIKTIKLSKFTQIISTNPYPELKLFDVKDSFVIEEEKELKKKKKAKLFNYDEDDYFDDYGTFNKSDLNSDQLFILSPENENVIFIWKGKDSNFNRNLIELGEEFIKKKKKSKNCLIINIEEGNELNEFWVYF